MHSRNYPTKKLSRFSALNFLAANRRARLAACGAFCALCVVVAALAVAVSPRLRRAVKPPTGGAAETSTAASRARLVESYGALPLSFEANRGQAAREVKFISRGQGADLFLTPTEAALELRGPSSTQQSGQGSEKRATLRMKLVGANREARVSGEEQLPGTTNYFIGNDPKKWRTDVPTYARVKYEGVYAGVDLVYYGNRRQLEYDFIVQPGAQPEDIRLSIEGASAMRIDAATGDLVLETEAGEVRQHKPVVYQEADGARQEVAGNYVLSGANEIGFEVGAYDAGRPLVIDPVLSYATYLGEGSETSIAVDAAGNAYVASHDKLNPPSPGAFNTSPAQGFTVTKLNAAGTAILYTAVIGGTQPINVRLDCSSTGAIRGPDGSCYRPFLENRSRGIAVGGDGSVYVAGDTISADFPTTPGAFQQDFINRGEQSPANSFVVKLSPHGSRLEYATLLAGRGASGLRAIAVDAEGQAVVVGSAEEGFPTTPAAFQPGYSPSLWGVTSDALVAKLKADGSGLVFATYLGGGHGDEGLDVAVDAEGGIYAVGVTRSIGEATPQAASFPLTRGAYRAPDTPVVSTQVFVTKFDRAGNLAYSSLAYGGAESDGLRIAVDPLGNAYITAFARATAGNPSPQPGTRGALQPAPMASDYLDLNQLCTYVMKLSADGGSRVYGTYLYGPYHGSAGYDIAVDQAGCAYVVGQGSYDFPSTANLFDTSRFVLFVTKLNAEGSELVYSFKVPGGGRPGVAVDLAGNAYVSGNPFAGFTPTINAVQKQPPQPDPHQPNAFVLKVAASVTPEPLLPTPPYLLPDSDVVGIGGRVKDAQGQGVEGVALRIEGTGIDLKFWLFQPEFINNWRLDEANRLARNFFTQTRGYYSLGVPARGSYVITPYKEGYRFTPASITLDNLARPTAASFVAVHDANAPAPPPETEMRYLAFWARNSSGTASLEGVTVTLGGAKEATAVTDATGKVIFGQLPRGGSYTATAAKPGTSFQTDTYTFNNLEYNQTRFFEAARTAPSPTPTPTPRPTPTPPDVPPVSTFRVGGRVLDRSGRGLRGIRVELSGAAESSVQTDNTGAYAFNNLPAGGSYLVTPQAAYVAGPTRLYANPGWVKLDNLSGPQTLNFVYNLTSPWAPPDPNPTPTPTPTPTPPPPPPTGGDGALVNPGFDSGGEGWAASGAVSFTNSQARLTVRLAPQTAIAQTVRVVPGATYELTATLTTNSAGRGTLGVRGDDGAILAAQTMGARAGGTLAVTFTVPAHASRVAVYCSASGAASTGLVTADSFTLTRKN